MDKEVRDFLLALIAVNLDKITKAHSIRLKDRPMSDIQYDEFLPDNFADILALIFEVLACNNKNPNLFTDEKERISLNSHVCHLILVYFFGYMGHIIQDRNKGVSSQKFREAEALLNAELAKKTI